MLNPIVGASPNAAANRLYRTIWRWHFYAALMVIPFLVFLAVTGGAYLFKPQIDAWEESGWRGLSVDHPVGVDAQVAAALAGHNGARVHHLLLPQADGDAAIVHIGRADGTMRDVVVSPQGRVLVTIDPDQRWSNWIARLHGSLLIGIGGSIAIELAGSWAIVMLVTGLFLWWPRGRGPAGVVWPRLNLGARAAWRDVHAVTAFWVSGLALVLLLTALPWTDVWATGFRAVRAEMGWVSGPQNWRGGHDLHGDHDHSAMAAGTAAPLATSAITYADIALRARSESLPHPVIIKPPGAPAEHGPPNGAEWTLTSQAQNRPLIRRIGYDPATGLEISRSGFADKHVIDRVVNYGIAWHEGQLFGWINQVIGLLTAVALIVVAISGFILWRRRAPGDGLDAPPAPHEPARLRGIALIIGVFGLLLPLVGASLIVLFAFDRLVLPHLPRMARWLGVKPVSDATS